MYFKFPDKVSCGPTHEAHILPNDTIIFTARYLLTPSTILCSLNAQYEKFNLGHFVPHNLTRKDIVFVDDYRLLIKNEKKVYREEAPVSCKYKNTPIVIDNVIFGQPINLVEMRKISSAEWIFNKGIFCWWYLQQENNEDIVIIIVLTLLESSRADIKSYITISDNDTKRI